MATTKGPPVQGERHEPEPHNSLFIDPRDLEYLEMDLEGTAEADYSEEAFTDQDLHREIVALRIPLWVEIIGKQMLPWLLSAMLNTSFKESIDEMLPNDGAMRLVMHWTAVTAIFALTVYLAVRMHRSASQMTRVLFVLRKRMLRRQHNIPPPKSTSSTSGRLTMRSKSLSRSRQVQHRVVSMYPSHGSQRRHQY